MSEPVDTVQENSIESDYADDYEQTTNRLGSGNLLKSAQAQAQAQVQPLSEEIDWLLKLRAQSGSTEHLDGEDIEPQAGPMPSGMSAHTAPPRMAPTVGARFSTGLRRGVLMLALSALAAGVLVGGGYLLASTSWLSSLFATESASVPVAQTAPAPPAPAQDQPQTAQQLQQQTQAQPAQPPSPANNQAAPLPPEVAATLAGIDARALRDKGIAQYKAGNYPEAVRLLEASINRSNDDPVTQYQLGLSYMAITRREHALDDAELAFRTAVSLQPQWAAPYQMVAETLMRRNFYKEAITPALQATRLEPTLGEAWLTLGRAYQGAGQPDEAAKAFAEAAHYVPSLPKP